METKYILGLKGIGNFFHLSVAQVMYLISKGGIPGIIKLKRTMNGSFPGGGRGVWALRRDLAEKYRFTRQNTPRYDPRRATEALLNRFKGSGATSIPELINMGLIDDMDWCMELNEQRAKSHMNIPILMHPQDLAEWLGQTPQPLKLKDVYPETSNIFKQVRNKKV